MVDKGKYLNNYCILCFLQGLCFSEKPQNIAVFCSGSLLPSEKREAKKVL